MKKILICATLFLFAAFFHNASAQFRLKNDNNIGSQPKWGPDGYNYVEYYYLPDIDTYYYVPRKQFIYQSGGYWTFSSSLPAANKHYNLYSANKVVINEPGAYRYYAQHKIKYAGSQGSNVVLEKKQQKSQDKQPRNSERAGG